MMKLKMAFTCHLVYNLYLVSGDKVLIDSKHVVHFILHSSWITPLGDMLVMGGWDGNGENTLTTELVTIDGNTSSMFDLKYQSE